MSQRSKLPLSEARLAANRANARKSTGPRTPAGKARSAMNACQHGFAGSHFAVARLEDPGEIDKFKADLVATYQPVNSQELFAIESIAIAQQSLRRAARLESGIFTACLNEAFDRRSDRVLVTMVPDMIASTDEYSNVERRAITRAQNRNYGLGEGFHRFTQRADTVRVFLRYQAQAERNYRRAKEDLLHLISLRDQLAVPQTVCQQTSDCQPMPTRAPATGASPGATEARTRAPLAYVTSVGAAWLGVCSACACATAFDRSPTAMLPLKPAEARTSPWGSVRAG
ncbi:MAG: hypothetical protein ACLQVN_11015 [Bryobacteraceae bacterium]